MKEKRTNKAEEEESHRTVREKDREVRRLSQESRKMFERPR